MSGRWWRAYERSRHDPKLLKLSDRDFRGWYLVVCTASAYGGTLPPLADLAIEIRRSEEATTKLLAALSAAALLDEKDGRYMPHNWNGLQYKSDVSNERVKRFRQRQCNVTETPSENRDREQKDTVAKATGAKAPARDVIFAECLPWLEKRSGKNCRALVGKWLSETGDDDAIRGLLEQAEQENPVDPVSWIAARLKPKEAHETYDQRRIRLGREAIREAMPQ